MREKLIKLVKRAITDWEHGDVSERIADHLIKNGVTFATDNNVGRWIIRSSGRGDETTNWAECSECHVCGSPQWKRCPVCGARMVKNND